MKATEIVKMSLEESRGYVADAIKDLSPEELSWRPKDHSNSIAFLLWHMARVEDLWINRILMGGKDFYESQGWYQKFRTPARDTGVGYDVAKLKAWPVPSLELLNAYAEAVRKQTLVYLKTVKPAVLEEERDFHFLKNTVGWALTHLITEVAEHSGQIGYIRGIMKGIAPQPLPPE